MGVALSIHGKARSYGSFSLGVSSISQSYKVSSGIFPTMDSIYRTNYPVSRSQVVLLILSFSSDDKNIRNKYACYL